MALEFFGTENGEDVYVNPELGTVERYPSRTEQTALDRPVNNSITALRKSNQNANTLTQNFGKIAFENLKGTYKQGGNALNNVIDQGLIGLKNDPFLIKTLGAIYDEFQLYSNTDPNSDEGKSNISSRLIDDRMLSNEISSNRSSAFIDSMQKNSFSNFSWFTRGNADQFISEMANNR